LQETIFAFNTAPSTDLKNYPVFLPGWGFDGRVTDLAEQPRSWLSSTTLLYPTDTVAQLVAFLDENNIESIVLSGWSMGSYLAIDFALAFPERVSALYLLAARQSWSLAEIEQIRADLAEDPATFMRSFYRKCFLGDRNSYRKFSENLQDNYLAALNQESLKSGLDYLASYPLTDRATSLAELEIPIYLLHGAKDIIAPPTEMADIPGAVSCMVKTAGHPVFLDGSCPLDWHLKKEAIRRKFSRSAKTYDEHAIVQKEVAEKLASLLPEQEPKSILETGCGTGSYTQLLRTSYPKARITAIDFADNMLEMARQKLPADQAVSFCCIDAEDFLKETKDRFDLVTSNATMHWFDDLPATCRLIKECLTYNGSLVCSIFGPDTMQELRTALSAIHGYEVSTPSQSFPGQKDLEDILTGLFSKVTVKEWQIVRDYPSLSALLKHISKTGTAGWHPGQPLLNHHNLAEVEQWFSDNYGGCRISYQVFMVSCDK
jgi:malonyl-ACP O-methyltransferase BioC